MERKSPGEYTTDRMLFHRPAVEKRPPDVLQLMTDTENFLRLHAVVLTLGQRCADWFLLRRLLLTATLGALIARLGKSRAFLCTRPEVEADNDVGEVEQHTNPQARLSKIVERLCDSWFGRHFSTAAMRAGTVNEDNIIRQLLAGPVVVAFYDVGLLVSKKLGFIGASPDGIAWVRRPGDVRASAPSPRASLAPVQQRRLRSTGSSSSSSSSSSSASTSTSNNNNDGGGDNDDDDDGDNDDDDDGDGPKSAATAVCCVCQQPCTQRACYECEWCGATHHGSCGVLEELRLSGGFIHACNRCKRNPRITTTAGGGGGGSSSSSSSNNGSSSSRSAASSGRVGAAAGGRDDEDDDEEEDDIRDDDDDDHCRDHHYHHNSSRGKGSAAVTKAVVSATATIAPTSTAQTSITLYAARRVPACACCSLEVESDDGEPDTCFQCRRPVHVDCAQALVVSGDLPFYFCHRCFRERYPTKASVAYCGCYDPDSSGDRDNSSSSSSSSSSSASTSASTITSTSNSRGGGGGAGAAADASTTQPAGPAVTPPGCVRAVVEMKTKVSEALLALAQRIRNTHGAYFGCTVDDAVWREAVPYDYRPQLVHAAVVTGMEWVLFVVASTSSIVYMVLVHVPAAQKAIYLDDMRMLSPFMDWAHHKERARMPAFVTEACRAAVESHWPLRDAMMEFVTQHGAVLPLQLFKTAMALLYSSTKGGVDMATEAAARLRSPSIK